MFDAIKDNWSEVDTRVGAAVTRLRRMRTSAPRGRQKYVGNAGRGGTGGDEAREGSALAQSTDDLLGTRRLFRSLNVTYQRLRDALRRFDSSHEGGASSNGRLDAIEFRAAVEAIGMFLTPDECDFLTAFALDTCGPRQQGDRAGGSGDSMSRNTGCVGIREFIEEVLRPSSTAASRAEGVAQAVVRFCMDLGSRKQRLLRKKLKAQTGGGQQHSSSTRAGDRRDEGTSSGSYAGGLRTANREMRRQLAQLQSKQQDWAKKAEQAEQYVEGRGPRPEWMRNLAEPDGVDMGRHGRSPSSDNASLRSREATAFRAKIENEKLRQKKRLLQQKIRQDAARARRLELKAAADPSLRAVAFRHGKPHHQRTPEDAAAAAGIHSATNRPAALAAGRRRPQSARRAPGRGTGANGVSVPASMRALVASIRGAIELDARFASIKDKSKRIPAFFDSLQAQVRCCFPLLCYFLFVDVCWNPLGSLQRCFNRCFHRAGT